VPAEIRHRWGRAPLALEDHGDHVVLRPAPDDPIAAARGALKAIVSDLTREDMRRQARKEDADRERECRSGEDRPRRLRAHCPALDEPGAEAGILREETPQSRASTTARRSPRLVRAGGAPEQRALGGRWPAGRGGCRVHHRPESGQAADSSLPPRTEPLSLASRSHGVERGHRTRRQRHARRSRGGRNRRGASSLTHVVRPQQKAC
jgi:hypothetical protein